MAWYFSLGKLCCDDLPALSSLLTNESNAYGLVFSALWIIDHAHQNAGVPKHPNIRFGGNRTGETAPASSHRNNVILTKEFAVKTATDKIVSYDFSQASGISFPVRCQPVAFKLQNLIFEFRF
jgi:hypothetical protein